MIAETQAHQSASPQEREADWTIAWLIEHADPELWAPRQFIIVDELTRGSPALAATWRAIYRLWIFYRPIGRRRFGLRMIADVGGVGRGHLSGKNGAIRKLRDLGLITVTGMGDSPRYDEARSESWEYDIDPTRLEALSIRLVRSRIAAGQLVARRRPEAHQRDLRAALDLAPDEATLDLAGARSADLPFIVIPPAAPDGATSMSPVAPSGATGCASAIALGEVVPTGANHDQGWHPSVPALAPKGTAAYATPAPSGATGPGGMAPYGAEVARNRLPQTPEMADLAPSGATIQPLMAPDGARWNPGGTVHKHDLAPAGAYGWMEREIEGGREGVSALPPPSLSPQAIEQLVERTLARQLSQLSGRQLFPANALGNPETATPLDDQLQTTLPIAPQGEPPLPLTLLHIWENVSRQRPITEHDLVQIRMLIGRYHEPAEGYSAYWLGRCMLFADLCRSDSEPIKLKLINAYMRRMSDTGFSTTTLENHTLKGERSPTGSERAARRRQPDSPESGDNDHPAIVAYVTAFDRAPNRVQAEQITNSITDLVAWQRVITDWQANGWKDGAVAKMLDRYAKDTGAAPAQSEAPPSAFTIHEYPGLTDEQRDRWVRRFHAAATPADKRAVLARLEQEHPR